MASNRLNDTKWWKADNKHDNIFGLAKTLESTDTFRKDSMLNFARMYSNSNILGLEPHSYSTFTSQSNQERIKINVVSSVVDTLSSKIAKNKPKVVLLPTGGDYSLQRRSSKLEKFIAGIFESTDVYATGVKAFLHAAVFGTGIAHVFSQDDNVAVENVLPHELLVDCQESLYGEPRQLLRRKHVDRQVLVDRFPKFEKAIASAGTIENRLVLSSAQSTVSDMVTIVEAWHLPSSPGSKDGRHAIVVDGATLLDEPWIYDDFPFVFLRWRNPLLGFWGRGVIEDIAGIQIEINRLLIRIQEAHRLLSNPYIFINMASAVSKAHMTSGIGTFIPYTGEPPTVQTFQTVHPEIYQYLNTLIARAYEIAGVSQQSSSSKNQLGPNASGAAIRELGDLETERFSLASQNYEKMFIEIAGKVIRLARDLYVDRENGLSVSVKGKKFIESIRWEDVAMEDDQFSLDIGAASMLPETKAGKIQMATEMLQAGTITNQEWRDLLDIPDLESSTDLALAPQNYIKDVIEKILDEGVVIEPEKYDNLQFAIKYAVNSYQKAKLNAVPEDRLELLRRYIETLDGMLVPPETMMAPGPAAPTPAPQVPQQMVAGVPPQ